MLIKVLKYQQELRAHCIIYEVLFINTKLGIIFKDRGGPMAVRMETILIAVNSAHSLMAFHVFTLPCSHLRENHTNINIKAQKSM